MLDSEVSWTEQAQLVAQLEEEECSLANQAEENSFMINRVRLMRTGDESQLDSAVKKSFQVRIYYSITFITIGCTPFVFVLILNHVM